MPATCVGCTKIISSDLIMYFNMERKAKHFWQEPRRMEMEKTNKQQPPPQKKPFHTAKCGVYYFSNTSTLEAEVGVSQIQGQTGLLRASKY